MSMEYPKQDIKKRIITIGGTAAIKKKDTDEIIGLNLIETIGEKETKYALWFTRGAKEANKDEIQGNRYPSAASIAFKEQQMMVGSKVGVAYVVTEGKPYTLKEGPNKGEERKGTNRTIRWFSTPDKIEEYDEESFGEGVQPDPTPNVKILEAEEKGISIDEIPFSQNQSKL